MAFENFNAYDMVEYIKTKKHSDDEWLDIGRWITEFLKGNPSPEERKLFFPLGYGEMVGMMCDGIIRMRKAICQKCKHKYSEGMHCTYHQYPESIPNTIWAVEDGKCQCFIPKVDVN